MEPHSPFANFEHSKPIAPSRIIYVLFCDICHHVWKAPAEAKICINCIGNGETVRSLASYKTETPIK